MFCRRIIPQISYWDWWRTCIGILLAWLPFGGVVHANDAAGIIIDNIESEAFGPPMESGLLAVSLDDTPLDATLDPTLMLFDEQLPTVFSASRHAQPAALASVPISVLTSEEIHHGGMTNIPDALAFTNGIDLFQLDRNRYAIGVRGLHDQFSDRVLTLIDGRLADSTLFGGSEFRSLPIMIEDISRIEVVRGPGGSAWGANAFTGAINIIMKEPEETLGFLASTTVSDLGDTYNHIRWGHEADKAIWRISLGYETQQPTNERLIRINAIPPTPIDTSKSHDFARTFRFDSELIYRFQANTRLKLGVGHANVESGDYEYGILYPGQNEQSRDTRLFTRLEHEFNKHSMYVQWFGNFAERDMPALTDLESHENDLETQWNFDFDDHAVSIGGNVRFTHLQQRDIEADDFVLDDQHLDKVSAGIFAVDRWQMADRIAIETQIRGDWNTETRADWSGRLSTFYSLDDEDRQVIRLSTARAFRMPLAGVREVSAQRIQVPFTPLYLFTVLSGEDLDHESTTSFEAGYSHEFSDHLTMRLNGYYQEFNGLIGYAVAQNVLIPSRTIFETQNIGDGRSHGGELEIEMHDTNGSVSFWYGLNEFCPQFDDQSIRAYEPATHKIGLKGRLYLPDGWTVSGAYRFTGNTPSDPAFITIDQIDASHRIDLSLAKRVWGDRAEIMVGVRDLLDETQQIIYGTGDLYAHETPGRIFYVRLQAEF